MKTAVVLSLAGSLVGACIMFAMMQQITEYTYRSLVHLNNAE